MNIIFMATPEFAVPALEAAHNKYGVKAVVTVPDKPAGRGKKLTASAIKMKALELGIPILQPEKLKDPAFIEELASFEPDIMAVIAFRILPAEVYKMAKIAAFNIHGSLLPKYRGAAPINWAIINGEKTTGLTSFILKEKVDTGDMLLSESIEIQEDWTAGDLHDALMPMAARLAVETIELIKDNNYKAQPQPDEEATPAPKLFPEHCRIDWKISAEKLKNLIHGVSPVPGAWTLRGGERVKIYRVKAFTESGAAGTYKIDKNSFSVFCGEGSLLIQELQEPGKKAVKIDEYLRGYRGPAEGAFDVFEN